MSINKNLTRLVIDHWKLLRAFRRTVDLLPMDNKAKMNAQLRFSEKRFNSLLEENEIKLVTFDGQKYEPNLPVLVLNAEDCEAGKELIIETTIEPAMIKNMKILVLGKVILAETKREKSNVSGN